MESANLKTPLLTDQGERSHNFPPSYYEATASSVNPNQPQPEPQRSYEATASSVNPIQSHPEPQRSYPSAPPEFLAPNIPPVQPQPIYQTNYYQQQNPPVVVIPSSPQIVTIQNHSLPLGPQKSYVTCPFCHIQKLTHVSPSPRPRAHLSAALLCLLGFWICACLPYFMESCMNADHYCGNCNKFLGTYYSGAGW